MEYDDFSADIQNPIKDIPNYSVEELQEITNRTRVHPDLFLDVQADTADAFLNGDPIHDICQSCVYLLEAKPEYAVFEGGLERLNNNRLSEIIISLTFRVYAVEVLSQKSWMWPIWVAGRSDVSVLNGMGRYFCSTDLVREYDPDRLAFDECNARQVLERLTK